MNGCTFYFLRVHIGLVCDAVSQAMQQIIEVPADVVDVRVEQR